MPKISKNIKKLRAERNITQDALAEKIHVTRQAISNWENDKTKPDIEALQSLAEAFEVEIEELIYGQKKEIIKSEDKTKEKNRIKIILAIIGSLFVAVGISLVFFGFWQDFSLPLKTAFSFVPIIMGQTFAIFTYLKKKDNLIWRECASVIWTIGVVSTIALIDYIYDISWVYTDYLIIDSILIIPIMFIFGAVAPLIFYFYMSLHISAIGNLEGILCSVPLFAIGVAFAYYISKNKEDGRNKYVQWLTVIASIPLVSIYASAGIQSGLISNSVSTIFIFVLAYLICMFVATPEDAPFSLPYKPVSLFGICSAMLSVSMGMIADAPTIEGELIPFIITILICVGAPVIAVIIKREDFEYNLQRIITVALPFAVIISTFVVGAMGYNSMAIFVVGLFTIAFGGMVVYEGVKTVRLIAVNIGILTVFLQIMSIYLNFTDGNIFALGILLLLFGAVLIGINWKMLSIKKSLKEQGGGTDA